MKVSNFKIRDRIPQKRKLDPLQIQNEKFDRKQSDHQIHSTTLQTKFQALMDKFQEFLNFQFGKTTQNIEKSATIQSKKCDFQQDCRDKFVIIDLPLFKTNQIQLNKLEVWIGQLCREVFSASFSYYSTGKFTYEQSKVYASQSFLRNICRLADKYDVKAEELKFIDQKMKNEILPFLKAKYPMTDEKDSNKSLQKAIKQINNIEVLANDYFYYTDIDFSYRENGRYDDLIMMVINQIMRKVNQNSPNSNDQNQITNFKDFQLFMSNIFQKTYDQSWMNSKSVQEKFLKVANTEKIIDNGIKNQNKENQKNINKKQPLLVEQQKLQNITNVKNETEKQKYKLEVQQYTNFKIGRKISENTQLFNEEQIKSQILTIKSPTILRILTKWCEQLWEKFSNENYFIDRTQGMRMQNDKQIKIVYPWFKTNLKYQMKDEKKNIQNYLKEIQQSNYFQQMLLLKNQLKDTSFSHIDKYQKVGGKFSCKVVNNLQNFIVVYLNRLIHGLNTVSKKFFDAIKSTNLWSHPPNLISFKIGDLIRCKFSSKQREVLRVFQQIERINDQNPEKMKIIRIKNRLKLGTNDILINVKFNNVLIGEIQLAVSSVKTEFIKCSYNFNHYIYQVQRSIFGPISEFCSIWKNLQNRSKQFGKLIQKQALRKQTEIIQNSICHKLNQPHKLIQNDRPFICCECSKAYNQSNFMINHVKCSKCIYWKCAVCLINEQKAAKNKDFFLTEQVMNLNSSFLESQNIPLWGVCIQIKKKSIKPILFRCIEYNQKKYLFKINYVQNKTELFAIIGSSKQLKKFLNQYIVFKANDYYGMKSIDISIDQAKTQFIIPSYIQKCFKNQKETISILQEQLSTVNLDVMQKATKYQKKCIKYIQFSETKLKNMDLISKDFINLDCLNLSFNNIKDISKILQFSKLENLYMLSNKIKIIPQEIHLLNNLKQIKLSQNNIETLPQTFSMLKSLTSFHISDNKLKSLPQKFYNLQNLKQLQAQSNNFVEIPISLTKHKKIQVINLSYNLIQRMPQYIQELKNLKQLNLSHNNLKILPIKMDNFQKLQKINLNNNKYEAIPKAICDLTNLIQLQICFNSIKNLIFEPQMQNLQKLSNIKLGSNQIQSINDSFHYLKYIQNVSLNQNHIKSLSQKCFTLLQLTQIDLSSNQIQSVQFNIFTKCKKLKKIKLSKNPIQQLPDQFQNLKNVRLFQIMETKISQFPISFLKFQHMEILSLSGFNMKVIPENIGDMKNLKQILLANNQIEKIPDSIGNIQELRKLDLSQNKITQFNPSIFKLIQLTQLYLQNNNIDYLPDNFKSLKNLKIFNIYCNKLKQLPKSISKLKNLTDFKFFNNLIQVLNSDFIKPSEKNEIDISSWRIKQIQNGQNQYSQKIMICKLKYNYFEYIPTFLFNYINVTIMDLSDNRIKQVSRQICKWKNLNNLNLQNNQIQSIPQQIGQLSQLSVLNLKCKCLKQIPKSIQKLKFKTIFLLGNKLENIHNLSYIHAEEVDFSNQLLNELSQNIGDLNHVKFMNFTSNKLNNLPESIVNSIQLQQLILTFHPLTSLPQNIGNLINLNKIILDNNKIQQIPNSIGNLLNLQYLSLQWNSLKKIPSSIGNCLNLIELRIRSNEIQEIPHEIGKLPKLVAFNGGANKIKQIPVEFYNQNIQSFFMQDNLIIKIPKQIKNMINLEEKQLILNGNPIQQIQIEAENFILQKGDSNTVKWLKKWRKIKKQKEDQAKENEQ